ncbi:MAG: formimidoylglutamate deiminase [Crocinitomicaceae bacterium]|nr:formimidoylglutamate deiminase [Crocinitomicaceae bacterium]|tara:strand:- start:1988 stop:3343 length:1356 start_codon:yes stop_codon:yes gene_type:complete
MSVYKFNSILFDSGWKDNIYITTNSNGNIEAIDDIQKNTDFTIDLAIPGFQNAHSHAFQYAMAGIAEYHPINKQADNFWSWRNAMYNLALNLNPDEMEAIATMLYSEMLKNGYTNVAEFHYLHHDKNGNKYNNIAEMGERLISAAKNAGINITLIPIFYQMGGFNTPPFEQQKRFINKSSDEYFNLIEKSKQIANANDNAEIGIGIHSLRAVNKNEIIETDEYNIKKMPFHIHVSEQLIEVEDCIKKWGARPVEWLLENLNLRDHHHLVHATHLNSNEIKNLAKSNANVVICPITEGNLGDGIFPLTEYQKHNGNWSIGSDSHVNLSPLEEIRLLDYGQRLTTHNRNTFTNKSSGNSSLNSFKQMWFNGKKAMGSNRKNYFEMGQSLDFIEINSNHHLIYKTGKNHILNTIIYSLDSKVIKETYIGGKRQKNSKSIKQNFKDVIDKIRVRL